MDRDELLEIFIEEANEILETLNSYWQNASKLEIDRQLITNFLQELHTLKGGARMVGLSLMSDMAHRFEQYCDQDPDHISSETIDEALMCLRQMIDAAANDLPMPNYDFLHDVINPQKDEPTLSKETIHFLHAEGLSLAKKLRATLNHFNAGELNFENITNLKEIVKSFKSFAKMSQSETFVEFCNQAETLVDNVSHLRQKLSQHVIDELYKIYEVILDGLESLVIYHKLIFHIDTHLDLNCINANETNPQKTASSLGGRIKVDPQSIDLLGQLGEKINVGRSLMAEKLNRTIFNGAETLKKLKLAGEAVRMLELQSDIVINSLQKEIGNGTFGFDTLEFDYYTDFQKNTRVLAEFINEIKSDFNLCYATSKELAQELISHSNYTSQLEEEILHIRMISFEQFIPRLNSLTNNIASELGKQVELISLKNETEVDRQILQRIMPALEHLIRNAIDHGIESPEERKAIGKAEKGTITISSFYDEKDLIIELSDDGSGIDTQKISEQAKILGIFANNNKYNEQELQNFIFHPGFSTKKEVTQISGRGVGMGVVSAQIGKLGGSVSVNSKKGEGTKFTLRLPVILSLKKVLIFDIANNSFALPITSILGVSQTSGEMLSLASQGEKVSLKYFGENYPCYSLNKILGVKTNNIRKGNCPVILVKIQSSTMGFVVDNIQGHREVVIKPLGKQLQFLSSFVGVANLGEGRLALMLSEESLFEFFNKHYVLSENEFVQKRSHRVMVVDDSLTIRKVTEEFLKRLDFDVALAADGIEAFALIDSFEPDLILLDIEMPRMNGYEFLQALRSQEKFENIPVIVITSRSQDKHRQKALELGASAYLNKPYSESYLLQKIESFLAKKHE